MSDSLVPPTAKPRRKLFIKTYGCQMNVYDSQRMADVLAPHGFEAASGPENADMVILNTCHIREKAAEKVFSDLGRLRPFKEARKAAGHDMTIAVAGCVAQAEGAEITKRMPYVDMVLGPQTYHRLPEMLALAQRRPGPVIDTEFPAEAKFDHLPPPRAEGPTAFLSVQEGCDKFCTFCVVPYTRGAEFSRPARDIIAEARGLVSAGVREITLLGQNVNAYHGDAESGVTWGLGRLIRALAEIDGLWRIRYTTSHPRDVDDELLAAHRDVPQLMPFLHLPVQSGSDRVLGSMNRGHTADDYRRIVARLREYRPDLALSSDFIVGYPGETDADFAATMALVEEIGYAQAFSFKYSRRPGTPAAALPHQVAEDVKARRLDQLQEVLERQQHDFNRACVGKVMEILWVGRGRHDGQLTGRSPYLQPAHINASADLVGRVTPVRLTALGTYSFASEFLDAKAA